MSGILDSKTRIMDTIVTLEGRRQLAQGGINVQYVSFTDGAAFYSPDAFSGSQDATRRVYLEACNLPQDEITFRADDDGNIEPFRNSSGVDVVAGRLLTYGFSPVTGTLSSSRSETVASLNGGDLVAASRLLLGSSIDNLKKMYIISSRDAMFDEDQFTLGPNDITYVITDERPINASDSVTHITSRDSVYSDPRFAGKRNFMYMPPVNRIDHAAADRSDVTSLRAFQLGTFAPLGGVARTRPSYKQIMHELGRYGSQGYSHTISFDPTSNENRLVGQFFERSSEGLRKLDVIDNGVHSTGDPVSPLAHVFFVGKVVVDEKRTDTFVHLFTLVFE